MSKLAKHKRIIIIALMVIMLMGTFQDTSEAHRAFFLQILIDEGQKLYSANVIKDTSVLESKKTEAKLWKYKGPGVDLNYGNLEGTRNGKKPMAFTFPPRPYKSAGVLKSKNNATASDQLRVYEIVDTLIPNLNELLLIKNGGKSFESTNELISCSEALVADMASGGTHNYFGTSVTYGDYKATVSGEDGKTYEYQIKMQKGYLFEFLEDGSKSPVYNKKFKYKGDIGAISIAHIVMQGNYTYIIHGDTSADAMDYSNPGTLELKLSELFASTMASLRSLLGLRSIDELVYNKGITGTSMYYGGIMPQAWMNNAFKFHMLFQALTWLALSLAVIKLLFQRNLATINPAARVSLIEGIKDLLLAGFMLISTFLIINLGININSKIVNVFATTVPDRPMWSGGNLDFTFFAGILMQLYYLGITIYLNVLYTMRAISTAILIASAPFFIASIAFQGKNKSLFQTWSKELLTNIFMQSFHAFTLSFLLSAQVNSVRGIELAVISFSLIPLTAFFKNLMTGGGGGMMDAIGASGIAMGGAAVSNVVGGAFKGGKGSKGGSGGGEGGGSDIKTKSSDTIKKGHSKDAPSKTSTDDALANRESSYTESATGQQMDQNREKLIENTANVTPDSKSGEGEGISWTHKGGPETADTIGHKKLDDSEVSKTAETTNQSTTKSKTPFKNTEAFSKEDIGTATRAVGSMAGNLAKAGAKAGVGAAAVLAFGAIGGGGPGMALMGSAGSDFGKAASTGGITAKEFAKKGVNTAHSQLANKGIINQGGNILGAEELDNGDIAIHRDRKMLEDIGVDNIKKTEEKDIAITYDKENLSKDHQDFLSNIETAYKNEDFDYLSERGISGVNKTEDGNTVVHYNEHGQKQLGFKDAYKNKNRIVETKAPGQELESLYIYDISKVPPKPQDANDGKGKTTTKTTTGNGYYGNKGDGSDPAIENLNIDDIID